MLTSAIFYDALENVTRADTFTPTAENSTITTELSGAYVKPFYEYDIILTGRWIFRNGWKFVIPPGLFGNLMILLVTLKMKPFNSTSLFMISLAIVDFSVNCFRIPFKIIPRLESTASCQVMWYMYNVLPVYSNYILLFWTFERVIAVQFPLRASEWCTVKRTAIVVAAAGIFSFAIMFGYPLIFVYTSRPGNGCKYREDMTEFIEIWFKIDSSFFAFIPMILISLSNVLIITRLRQSTKRHQQMTSSEESRKKREKEQRNTTITLTAVCFAFLVLHMPIAIYNIFSFSVNEITNQEEKANWTFLNMFGLSLMEVQNSVNFYLYFLTGRRYRQVTFNIIFPCRQKPLRVKQVAESTINTGVSVSSKAG